MFTLGRTVAVCALLVAFCGRFGWIEEVYCNCNAAAYDCILTEKDMKALIWQGKKDIRYETAPDPRIEHPRDAIVKVSSCAICGSDLHLFDGFMPGMKSGDIMGHEFMGEVVEVGKDNSV